MPRRDPCAPAHKREGSEVGMVEYRGNGARRRSSPEAGKKVLLAAFLQEIEGGDALRGEYRRSRHRGPITAGEWGGEPARLVWEFSGSVWESGRRPCEAVVAVLGFWRQRPSTGSRKTKLLAVASLGWPLAAALGQVVIFHAIMSLKSEQQQIG
ncbi:hypothetical protein PR202_ga11689 [Eleusine coracana subsp. coracana]|uniref:Uncharacterized protein n=1 Tax=Eleusine coracana subsp. coracana TaxID=191504 RepID=A0AAV5CA84_ELECO|nr:hypothetical protein PR202_ga11689 [Eleusine coracana subsp. coracana]